MGELGSVLTATVGSGDVEPKQVGWGSGPHDRPYELRAGAARHSRYARQRRRHASDWLAIPSL